MNYVSGKRIFNILNHVIFPANIQISKPIDVSVFMFDLRMINMSSECEYDSTTNFIFWLGMLIFSVSINSHPDNIYWYISDCDKR